MEVQAAVEASKKIKLKAPGMNESFVSSTPPNQFTILPVKNPLILERQKNTFVLKRS